MLGGSILLLVIIVNLLLCLAYKLKFVIVAYRKSSIFSLQYYVKLQTSTGALGMHPKRKGWLLHIALWLVNCWVVVRNSHVFLISPVRFNISKVEIIVSLLRATLKTFCFK